MISSKSVAQTYDLVAAELREAPDMGLALGQTKLHLEPAVGFLPGHKPLLPEPIQSGMGLPPLFPQLLVRQCAHGKVVLPMGGYVGIAGGVTGADVDLIPWPCMTAHQRSGPEKRWSAAVWTFDFDSFH